MQASADPPELEAELWIEAVNRNVFNRFVRSCSESLVRGSRMARLRLELAALKFSDRRVARFLLDQGQTTHSFRVACAQNDALYDLVNDEDVSMQDVAGDHAEELVRECALGSDGAIKRIEQLLTKTSPNACGGKPLMLACERGDLALLRLLIADPRTDLNIADDLALKLALANRHVAVVDVLVATGKFELSDRQRQILNSMQLIPEADEPTPAGSLRRRPGK
jgi:ankyrin repeat protein